MIELGPSASETLTTALHCLPPPECLCKGSSASPLNTQLAPSVQSRSGGNCFGLQLRLWASDNFKNLSPYPRHWLNSKMHRKETSWGKTRPSNEQVIVQIDVLCWQRANFVLREMKRELIQMAMLRWRGCGLPTSL